MNELTIRGAVPADVPVIVRLIHGLAAYERLAQECVADDDRVRESLFGSTPGAEVLMAEVAGEPAGFALYFHNYSTFLAQRGIWLEDLFVEPRFRGHGIGRALLERLAALTVERGCGRLEWSVLDWNEDAIAFYRRLGAVAMSDWTTYRVTGDALVTLSKGAVA